MVWCELHNKIDKIIWRIYGYPAMYHPVKWVKLGMVIEDIATLCLFPIVAWVIFIAGFSERRIPHIKFFDHRFYCSNNEEDET